MIILKSVLIIGVIIVCSIIALTIGLSMDKILSNQNNLEIKKDNLELENVYKQEESLSKTTEELTDSNVSVIFSKIFDDFSASHSMKMNFINFDNFDVYLTLKDFNLCKINCNTITLYVFINHSF